jgi:TonB family protein
VIERQNPSYPEQELRRGGEGWVAMSFMVSETGAVTDAMVESSNVLVHLDDLARRSQQTWTVPTSFGSCRFA